MKVPRTPLYTLKPSSSQSLQKHTRNKKIILTNLDSITMKNAELELEVDPIYELISRTFGDGRADGLMMNNLEILDDNQLMVLYSNFVVPSVQKVEWAHPERKLYVPNFDKQAILEILGKMNLDEKQICPPLADVKIASWDGSDITSDINREEMSEFAYDNSIQQESPSDAESDLPDDLQCPDLPDISDDERSDGDENTNILSNQLSGEHPISLEGSMELLTMKLSAL